MKIFFSFCLLFSVLAHYSFAEDRVLFDFKTPADAKPWQAVNDGVMGGRSIGQFRMTNAQRMEFFGTLSLANNGGFASVRARTGKLNLKQDDVIVARVKGDGREYKFNVYAQQNLGGYSYRQSFQTKQGEWIEVEFPIDQFKATWRGRSFPNEKLDPASASGLGFLLGDKKPGPFKLEVDWIKIRPAGKTKAEVSCEGTYPHHLQGIAKDDESIYWSFTTVLVKTDSQGNLLKKVEVINHHGDLCVQNGKVYVAVNLGKFNDPQGNADSWVYVYDAESLQELARHDVQEVVHGAGGIGFRSGHFFVIGGLPPGIEENYVYEYDSEFKFVHKHVIASDYTLMGIQSATFAHDRWWFGCYGNPPTLLVTDDEFQMLGRHEFNCSLGIEELPDGKLLAASGQCTKGVGCTGRVQIVVPDDKVGLRY